MSDSVRAEMLLRLGRVLALAPDMRLGQLIANCAMAAGDPYSLDVWDLEDDQALDALKKFEHDFSGIGLAIPMSEK